MCGKDYTKCEVCPLEYFKLFDDRCVGKEPDLKVILSWYDETEQEGYVQFNQPVLTNQSQINEKLKLNFEDFQGNTFMKYENLSLSLVNSTTIKVKLRIFEDVYDSKIILKQTSEKSFLFNNEVYMDVNKEMVIKDVWFIKSNIPQKLLDYENHIQLVVWGIMIFTLLFGTCAHPWAGTLVLRTVSMFSQFSNLNGQLLHSSDLLFDILGNVSFPLKIGFFDKIYHTNDNIGCVPGLNFQKRRNGYSSCNLTDHVSKSLIVFLVFSIFPLIIYFRYFSKKSQHSTKLKQDETYFGDSSIAYRIIMKKFFGPRLLIIIFEACSPILLKYSILTASSSNRNTNMVIGSVLSWVIICAHFVLQFALFRTVYNFIDLQHLQILKYKSDSYKYGRSTRELLNSNKVHPKIPGGNLTISPRKDKIRVEEREIGSKNEKDLSNDGVPTKVELPNKQIEAPPELQTVDLRKVAFPWLNCFIERFKMRIRSSHDPMYYLALVELTQTMLAQFILVRFSDDGLIQIYIIGLFEAILTMMVLIMKPFEKAYDLAIVTVYKLLILAIYTLKILNFAKFSEKTRQEKIDLYLVFLGIGLLAYSVLVGFASSIGGIITISKIGKLRDKQLEIFEKDKMEMNLSGVGISKDALPKPAPQDLNSSKMPLNQDDSNLIKPKLQRSDSDSIFPDKNSPDNLMSPLKSSSPFKALPIAQNKKPILVNPQTKEKSILKIIKPDHATRKPIDQSDVQTIFLEDDQKNEQNKIEKEDSFLQRSNRSLLDKLNHSNSDHEQEELEIAPKKINFHQFSQNKKNQGIGSQAETNSPSKTSNVNYNHSSLMFTKVKNPKLFKYSPIRTKQET